MSSSNTRSPLAIARDSWINENRDLINEWSSEANIDARYIENRLERAFLDGANAQSALDNDKKGINANNDAKYRFLLNPNNKKGKAHIWTGEDTVCQMTSTVGFTMDKYVVSDDNFNLSICTFCKEKRKYGSGSRILTLDQKQVVDIESDTKIFCDGACMPNPGKAGSGIAIYRNNRIYECWYGKYNPAGTNNTAELNALYQSLIIAADELKQGRTSSIFCDSQYSIQCVTEWASGWEKKGWKKSNGHEIKNIEIVKPMYELYKSIEDRIEIWHVNGHVGIEGNELADRMSMLAIMDKKEDISTYQGKIDVQSILSMSKG